MSVIDLARYGSGLAEVVSEERVMPLGPGTPNVAMRDKLAALTPESAFDGKPIADNDMARAAISGAWLYHDFLDESHTISQGISASSGSYWHAIMHRREPDYPNSKFWFSRTGHHPIFEPLAAEAAELASDCDDNRAVHLSSEPAWDPYDFVDLVETAVGEGDDDELAELCRAIQMREWALLMDHCCRHALGQ